MNNIAKVSYSQHRNFDASMIYTVNKCCLLKNISQAIDCFNYNFCDIAQISDKHSLFIQYRYTSIKKLSVLMLSILSLQQQYISCINHAKIKQLQILLSIYNIIFQRSVRIKIIFEYFAKEMATILNITLTVLTL